MSAAARPGVVASLRLARHTMRDLHGALDRLHALGDVVDVGIGPSRFVYAFGAEANETILSSKADHFTWAEILEALVPVDGPTALVVPDGPDHDRRRKLVQPAFHRRRVDGYLTITAEEVTRTVAGWEPDTTVDVHEAMRRCIRRIVMRSLFGEAFAARSEQFGDLLEPALAYVNRPPWTRVDARWFPPYRRAMAARDAADRLVYDEIARRRTAGARAESDQAGHGESSGDDVLSWLLEAQDGDELSDLEVRDQVVSLIAAGYDTTSAAAAWLVDALYRHPDVLARLRDEIDRELPDGAAVDAEALQRMKWLDGVVSETLRLWPPGAISGRQVQRDVEICGVPVPRGRKVLYSAWVTQRDPRWWPDPLRFEPGRWVPGDPHHQPVAPATWVVFGGGARRCIGFAMAITELKAIAVELARRVDLELRAEPPMPTGIATTVPSGGVPARVRLRP